MGNTDLKQLKFYVTERGRDQIKEQAKIRKVSVSRYLSELVAIDRMTIKEVTNKTLDSYDMPAEHGVKKEYQD